MGATENKQLMQGIFDEWANGNSRALVEHLADDVVWRVSGTPKWAREYRGKGAVLKELMKPLSAHFASTYTNTASRLIAEGDTVVVESLGDVMTKSGKPFKNRYCWVCRLRDGQIAEITEYMDTHLVVSLFGEDL